MPLLLVDPAATATYKPKLSGFQPMRVSTPYCCLNQRCHENLAHERLAVGHIQVRLNPHSAHNLPAAFLECAGQSRRHVGVLIGDPLVVRKPPIACTCIPDTRTSTVVPSRTPLHHVHCLGPSAKSTPHRCASCRSGASVAVAAAAERFELGVRGFSKLASNFACHERQEPLGPRCGWSR